MSLRTDVLLWAQRVMARKNGPPHLLLEVPETATAEQIQEAFHKIARTSHPDLHRHGLNAEELELVTSAYAACAGAYQQMRTATMRTTRMQPVKPAGDGDNRAATPPTGSARTAIATPPEGVRIASGSNLTQGTRHYQPGKAATATPQQTTQVLPVNAPGRAGQPSPPAGTPTTRPGTPPPDSGPSTAPIAQTANPEKVMSSKALLYYRKAESCLRRGDLKGAMLQLKLACAADPTSQFLRTALAEVEAEMRKQP